MHQHLKNYHRSYLLGVLLNLLFVCVGVWYGLQAHSLALISDAAHNATDVLGLIVSWCGTWLLIELSGSHQSMNKRTALLLSLCNTLLLALVSSGIIFESIQRLLQPEAVTSSTVLAVALLGIGINGYAAYLFMHGRHHDLNMRGAFLHMAGDALFSVGVVGSALVISATGWNWMDPAASLVISTILLCSALKLLRDSWSELQH